MPNTDKVYEYLTLTAVYEPAVKRFYFLHNEQRISQHELEQQCYRMVQLKWGKGVFKRIKEQ